MRVRDEILNPYREQVAKLRSEGTSWNRIAETINTGYHGKTIHAWCKGWMDADLLQNLPRGGASIYYQKKLEQMEDHAEANRRFAEAMAGRTFSSMRVSPDVRMRSSATFGYVPGEAIS